MDDFINTDHQKKHWFTLKKNEGVILSILNTNKLLVHHPILENEGIIFINVGYQWVIGS